MRTSRTLVAAHRLAVAVSALALVAFLVAPGHARTVVAVLETTPTMPGQDFSFALSLQPQDVDVSGFNLRIGFDAGAVSFVGV